MNIIITQGIVVSHAWHGVMAAEETFVTKKVINEYSYSHTK